VRLPAAIAFVAAAVAWGAAAAQDVPIPPPPPADGAQPMTVERVVNQLGLDWSLRGSYWTRDHNLERLNSVGTATAWLRARPRLAPWLTSRFEGWVTDQKIGHGSNVRGELREGNLIANFEPFELRIGREIVAWGRADRVNPTDVISSRDFTLLFPEDDDQRRGNAMMHARWGQGGYTVSALWLPEFRPNRYPNGSQPPGIILLGEHSPTDVAQFGLRLDRTGDRIDWSISYFDGLDRDPRFQVAGLSPTVATVSRRYDRIRQIGADATTNVGEFGLRGEIAYTFSPDGAGPNYRRSGVYMVLGGDRTFAERLNVNVQYIYRFVDGWQDPTQVAGSLQQGLALRNAAISNQRYRNQHGVTARVAYRWPGDKFETELSAIFNATALDGLVRTRFVYKATDQLRLSIGGDWFFGNEDTYLGEFRRNSGAFLEVRYGY